MKKILLVEDDMFIRDIYSRELKKVGYEVDVAEDGETGLEKATTQQYDLMLLDIMLPKKTGIEVLTDLRKGEANNATPVFLLTNLGQGSVIKQAVDVGIQGYLLKARFLPSQVTQSIEDFFTKGPMKIDLKEFGLE